MRAETKTTLHEIEGVEVVAKFDLPYTYRCDDEVEQLHYELRRRVIGKGCGGLHLVQVGGWENKKGITEAKTKEDVQYNPTKEKLLISFTTDHTTEVALDSSLSVMWFEGVGFSEDVSAWKLERLLKESRELATLREAFSIISKKED